METSSKKLTAQQIQLLKLLYKFRFVSAPLLAQYRNLSRVSSTARSLQVLVDRSLVFKKYNKSYRLQGKPASYCLAPKALTYLRDEHGLDQAVLHSFYKNKSVSDGYIAHHLVVLETFLKLREAHAEEYRMYSKYEISGLDSLPELKPDIYLYGKSSDAGQPGQILVYAHENSGLFVIKKQLKQIYAFYEDETCEGVCVVVICKNGSQEKALSRVSEQFQEQYVSGLNYQIATITSIAI